MHLPTFTLYTKSKEKAKKYLKSTAQRHSNSSVTDVPYITVPTESEHYQALIKKDAAKRNTWLSMIDSDKYSTTKDIPDKILSVIFCFACGPFEPDFLDKSQKAPSRSSSLRAHPAVLAAVSSRWRAVVNATPQLWSFIGAEVNNRNVPLAVSLLRRCLDKSKGLSVAVDLDFQKQSLINRGFWNERFANGLVYHPYGEIFPHLNNVGALQSLRSFVVDSLPERVRTIRLFDAPLQWFPESNSLFNDRFILLEAIFLSWKYMENATDFRLDLSSLPKLKEVFLFGFPSQHIMEFIVPTTLTILHLSQIDYNACVAFLPHCKNLCSLSMMRPLTPTRSTSENTISRISPLELTYLEDFEWTFPQTSDNNMAFLEIFALLSTPSLRTLALHEPWSNVGLGTGLHQFLDRLPDSCQSITLVATLIHPVPLCRIVDTLTQVPTTVSQVELRIGCMCLANSVWGAGYKDENGSTSEPENMSECYKISKVSVIKESRFGGNARSIHVQDPQFCEGRFFSTLEFFKVMERRAFMGPKTSQKISLEYDTSIAGFIKWEEYEKDGLRGVVVGGLDLEILEDGKQVSWL